MTMVEQQEGSGAVVDVLEGSGMIVEQGGSGAVVDVLARLHHLRTTLRQCHQRVERVDSHVHALHARQKDFTLLYTFLRKPHDLGGANIRGVHTHPGGALAHPGGDHTHPGVFTFPENAIQTPQEDQEQAVTWEEPEAVEGEQEDEKENKTNYTRQDSMSEVREAEEHLLQTEWTEVVGELTESFELAQDEVEEEGQKDTEDGASGARQRPPLRRQESIEIEDYDPHLSNVFNNLRLENKCDGDHVEEDNPFDSSHSPNLLAPGKQDINGIIPNVSKELCEEVIHSVAEGHDEPTSASERDDHKGYPSHCNEDPVERSSGPPLNVAHSLEVLQETLDLLRDHFTSLHNALSGFYKKPDQHHRQGTSTVPSEVVTMFDFESPFGLEGLRGDIKNVPDVEKPPTKLPDQDFKEPGAREGEEQIAQVMTESSSSTPESHSVTGVHQQHTETFSSTPESHSVAGVHQQHTQTSSSTPESHSVVGVHQQHTETSSNIPESHSVVGVHQQHTETSSSIPESHSVVGVHQQHTNVIFHRGRKQDLRDSLTFVLVVFLVMFALLFLACCLLLVVPVVTVSVRTTGGPPVF